MPCKVCSAANCSSNCSRQALQGQQLPAQEAHLMMHLMCLDCLGQAVWIRCICFPAKTHPSDLYCLSHTVCLHHVHHQVSPHVVMHLSVSSGLDDLQAVAGASMLGPGSTAHAGNGMVSTIALQQSMKHFSGRTTNSLPACGPPLHQAWQAMPCMYMGTHQRQTATS